MRKDGNKLLKTVHGMPRDEFDAHQSRAASADNSPENSPDPISRPGILAPTIFKLRSSKRIKANSGMASLRSIGYSTDDLSDVNAPTIAEPRSRKTSMEPGSNRRSASTSRSNTKPNSEATSIRGDEEIAMIHTSSDFLVNSIFAGKSPEEAKRDSRRFTPKPVPDNKWAGYAGNRRPKVESVSTYRSKRATYSNHLKSETINLINPSEKPKQKPRYSKNEPEKVVDRSLSPLSSDDSSDDDVLGIKALREKAKTKAPGKPTFINPKLKHTVPIHEDTYKELGVQKKPDTAPVVFLNPIEKYGPITKFDEFRTDPDICDLTSSPQTIEASSQSSHGESRATLAHDKETMDLMSGVAAMAGIKDIGMPGHELESINKNGRQNECKLCRCSLPEGFLEPWFLETRDGFIRLDMWSKICIAHTTQALEDEWREKNYPVIEWGKLGGRTNQHLPVLKRIIANKHASRYRDLYSKQQKEIKGNTVMLLRQEHKLPFPGYYGPRGADILLDALMSNLGSKAGDAAKKDALIAGGGVSAFMQQVLVPEVAVRLIAEDMNVSESKAFEILESSREIGERLNSGGESGDLYGDNEADNWVDINATQQQKSLDDSWEEMDY